MHRDRWQLRSLYLLRFASSFGFIAVITLLPTYIDVLGLSGALVGVFVAGIAIARGIAIVPITWSGDRYDKRTILLVMLVVSVAAYVLYGVIETSYGLLTARLLQGLGAVGTGVLSLALVSELAPGGERANAIGRYNAFRMAGGILGTLGAGLLYTVGGFVSVFAVIAGLLVLSGIGVERLVAPDETSIGGIAFFELAGDRAILTIVGFRVQYAVAVTLVRNWVPIYVGVSAARGGLAASTVAVGIAVAAEKFTNMLGQPIAGRLADRSGRTPFVAAGGTMYGLVALAIGVTAIVGIPGGFALHLPLDVVLTTSVLVVCGLNGLLGLADSLREPASMAIFGDAGAGSGVASSFGIRNIVWLPGSILAPLVGGLLMDSAGLEWVFFLGGAAALTGVLTLGVAGRVLRAHATG